MTKLAIASPSATTAKTASIVASSTGLPGPGTMTVTSPSSAQEKVRANHSTRTVKRARTKIE